MGLAVFNHRWSELPAMVPGKSKTPARVSRVLSVLDASKLKSPLQPSTAHWSSVDCSILTIHDLLMLGEFHTPGMCINMTPGKINRLESMSKLLSSMGLSVLDDLDKVDLEWFSEAEKAWKADGLSKVESKARAYAVLQLLSSLSTARLPVAGAMSSTLLEDDFESLLDCLRSEHALLIRPMTHSRARVDSLRERADWLKVVTGTGVCEHVCNPSAICLVADLIEVCVSRC